MGLSADVVPKLFEVPHKWALFTSSVMLCDVLQRTRTQTVPVPLD